MFVARTKRPLSVSFPRWGVVVLESRHAPGFRMEPMRNDFLKVLFVLDGAGTFDLGARKVPLAKGDVVFVPAGVSHRLKDDPSREMSILFLCLQDSVWKAFPDLAGPAQRLRHPALAGEVLRLLRRLFVEQSLRRPGGAALMTGLALEVLGAVAQTRDRRPPRVPAGAAEAAEARVRDYARDLRERFYEVEKIDNVAERLGMSRRTFTRLFRKVAGRSWLDELHRLRLDHARTLLLRDDRTVLWIALECGFEDVSTFYRAFRKAEGVSPLAWREKKSGRAT